MIADSIEMRRRDIAGMIKGAREEEREKGEKQLKNIAHALKGMGLTADQIVRATKLPPEEIAKL
jgi:hypothetical protein